MFCDKVQRIYFYQLNSVRLGVFEGCRSCDGLLKIKITPWFSFYPCLFRFDAGNLEFSQFSWIKHC